MAQRTVLVTGASRGLGAAAARILVEAGANVVMNARSEEALQENAAQFDSSSGQTLAIAGDVSQPDVCRQLVERALEHFGALHAIINNAGVLTPIAPIAETGPEAWRVNIEVNLLGPYYLTRFALPYLRQGQGRLINVSSGAAVRATEGWSAYCAAKAALNHFTRVLAAEEPQIVSLAVRPGVVDTEMQRTIREQGEAGMPPDSHRRFVQYHTSGELLPPEAPGRALAALALHAPLEWSGEFISWDESRVRELAQRLT
jgi:NAD(P)-dependent dehydrogenase (short-subunit alcohol dehydrogenase family)